MYLEINYHIFKNQLIYYRIRILLFQECYLYKNNSKLKKNKTKKIN